MTQDFYQRIIRPLLFRWNSDPEQLHHQLLAVLGWWEQHRTEPVMTWLHTWMTTRFCLDDSRLQQTLWGLTFPNPVGLAAGFDKDGAAATSWASLGFGFAELGTVTLHAQPGNPRPRLFRLPDDRAVLNRMGFNNQGAAAMAERLQSHLPLATCPSSFVTSPLSFEVQGAEFGVRSSGIEFGTPHSALCTHYPITNKGQRTKDEGQPSTLHAPPSTAFPIGINLGKSKITPLESAAEDYVGSFRLLRHLGDYFVVNVSSPNTPGLRSLQSIEQLDPILAALQQENLDHKPLLVKIAPDLSWEEIAAILKLATHHHLAGIIATNTTIRREGLLTQRLAATGNSIHDEAGGISGAPLRQQSTAVIRFIWQETQGTLPIVGVGGIFTAEDAWEKITAGASLVQLYTGWVYEGPWVVRRILAGLAQKLESHGLTDLTQAVGLEAKNSSPF